MLQDSWFCFLESFRIILNHVQSLQLSSVVFMLLVARSSHTELVLNFERIERTSRLYT